MADLRKGCAVIPAIRWLEKGKQYFVDRFNAENKESVEIEERS